MAFEIISETEIGPLNAFSDELTDNLNVFLGRKPAAEAGIMMLNKWQEKSGKGLLSVSHKKLNDVRAALLFVEHLNNKKVIVRSVGASGLLNKAVERYL